MPILAMASYSLIYRRGIDRFVADAVAAGLAGFVVPDLPIEESDDLDAACRTAGLALVRLVTPTTPPDRAEAIARKSTGFLYCVSVAGVTGARTELPPGLVATIRQALRTQLSPRHVPDEVHAVRAVPTTLPSPAIAKRQSTG
jgi:tryptophan synthase alpha chain